MYVEYNTSKIKKDIDFEYLDDITKIKKIPEELYNDNMKNYFNLRYSN